jgi:hypothetical protein
VLLTAVTRFKVKGKTLGGLAVPKPPSFLKYKLKSKGKTLGGLAGPQTPTLFNAKA